MLEGSLVLRRAFSQNGSLLHIDMCGANWIPRLFDRFELKTRAFYTGNPWFLPLVLTGYKLIDRFGR